MPHDADAVQQSADVVHHPDIAPDDAGAALQDTDGAMQDAGAAAHDMDGASHGPDAVRHDADEMRQSVSDAVHNPSASSQIAGNAAWSVCRSQGR